MGRALPLARLPLSRYLARGASVVAQMVKRLPTTWETWVQSLGPEDFLEKEMATHSSSLAWRIAGTVEPGELKSMGHKKVRLSD